MNEFKTDVQGTKGFYTIEYRTNSRANYEEAQELLRKFVDNKPKTIFDKITESVESLAEFLNNVAECCNWEDCRNCPLKKETDFCNLKGITEYLQKEIEE